MRANEGTPAHREGKAKLWVLETGSASVVVDMLKTEGWNVAHSLDGNTHCSSPDGRVYVGWLPEKGYDHENVWIVAVENVDGKIAWVQDFADTTPCEFIAAFVAALI
ncbi:MULTISPECIES: DUF317 domain-containing protein [Streptomyces]|uniref:DUF317 domain-containing protein n=1 Tax=Streptomyces TaxID=1883 RepID=UPI00345BDBFF